MHQQRPRPLARDHLMWALCAATLVLGSISTAAADAIGPEPSFCPPGTFPYSGHGGAGCAPDYPDDCPEGYEPRVANDIAYCEPPAATACPTGSVEESRGPNQPICRLLRPCDDDRMCGPGSGCRPSRLCLTPNADDPRFGDFRAYGSCDTDADCERGQACDVSMRCDPDVHRVDPEGRTLEAIVRAPPRGWLLSWMGIALAVALAISIATLIGVRTWRRRTRGSE